MRCNPLVRRLQQLVASGVLGEVRQVRADLGFVVDKPPTDRLLDPALGGGALLDMGIYPLTFAHLFLGEPSAVAATAALSEPGVDLNLALSLGYPSGAVASLTRDDDGLVARGPPPSPRTAAASTCRRPSTTRPRSPGPRWRRPGLRRSPEPEEIRRELPGTGLAHEALEVVRCLRSGETESPLVPLDETVALMRLMDRIREPDRGALRRRMPDRGPLGVG